MPPLRSDDAYSWILTLRRDGVTAGNRPAFMARRRRGFRGFESLAGCIAVMRTSHPCFVCPVKVRMAARKDGRLGLVAQMGERLQTRGEQEVAGSSPA